MPDDWPVRRRAIQEWRHNPVTSLVVGWLMPEVGHLMGQLDAADLDAEAGADTPAIELGRRSIAQVEAETAAEAGATEPAPDVDALRTALLHIELTHEPSADMESLVDALTAGVVEAGWRPLAGAGAPAEPAGDTERGTGR